MILEYFASVFSGTLAPVHAPVASDSAGNFAEPGTFDVKIHHFGLPNDERYFPTRFDTLRSDSFPVWDMIDNGAHPREVLVAILGRCGYLGKAAWSIAENDRHAFQFYMDVLDWRGRVCDYQRQQISYMKLVGSILHFCLKNLYRACRGSIISREVLSLNNLDKLAANGQENPKSATKTYQEPTERSDVLAHVNASGIDPTMQKANHGNTKTVLNECLTQPSTKPDVKESSQGKKTRRSKSARRGILELAIEHKEEHFSMTNDQITDMFELERGALSKPEAVKLREQRQQENKKRDRSINRHVGDDLVYNNNGISTR